MRLCREEVYRYLGYGKDVPDLKVNEIIDECERILMSLETVRYIYKIYDDICISEGVTKFGGAIFESRELSNHLSGCRRAVLLCATLGSDADRIRLKYENLDLTRAVVMDASQNAYIEQVCDKACDEIFARVKDDGFFLTPRFSPGYGDLSLTYQPIVLSMMDAGKRIGLTCSETNLLTPQKSVTAIIGLSDRDKKCGKEASCLTCAARAMCRFCRA